MEKSTDNNFDNDEDKYFECAEDLQSRASQSAETSIERSCEDLNEIEISKNLEHITLEKDPDKYFTEEEKKDLRNDSLKLKDDGNAAYKQQNYAEAETLYTEGLRICPECFKNERSILYSNRAACFMNLEKKDEAIQDCTTALDLKPDYVKALQRRALLYESSDKLDEALSDYKKLLELHPDHQQARLACAKLPGLIQERNEKLKAEMIGSLKEMGNKLLGKFGLSTDNFQLEQNPQTGSYNIQFKQNPNK